MQALVLAAGRSKRFWPLSDKNFLQFGGKFLIERQIEILRKAGVRKFIIVGGCHNIVKLRETFPRFEIIEQKNLNMGMSGAILAARNFLNQPTLITSTNDVFSTSIVRKVIAAKNCDGVVLAQEVKQYFPGGYLKTSNENKIVSVVEKPQPGNEPSNLVNIVCHFFHDPQKLITALQKTSNKKDDGYERALSDLFKKQKFIVVKNPNMWQAVKFPWHALDLSTIFLKTIKRKISPQAKISKRAVISGAVVIEAGVNIFDFAVINGPAFIGRNSIVGTHSLVRNSIIGVNSVIGSGSEVARSILMENVWLHRNYIGDSILAENVSLGSGVVLANLRLDSKEVKSVLDKKNIKTQRNKFGCVIGANTRIGVNTSIMPGVLIGDSSFIGSGMVVEKNLKSGYFLKKNWKNITILNKTVINNIKKV